MVKLLNGETHSYITASVSVHVYRQELCAPGVIGVSVDCD